MLLKATYQQVSMPAYRGRCSCRDELIKIQDTYLHALDERDWAIVRLFAMGYI